MQGSGHREQPETTILTVAFRVFDALRLYPHHCEVRYSFTVLMSLDTIINLCHLYLFSGKKKKYVFQLTVDATLLLGTKIFYFFVLKKR